MEDNLQIKDYVEITHDSYNLKEWEKILIQKAIIDHPSFTYDEIAEKLNISVRNLYRLIKEYNINVSIKMRKLIIKNFEVGNF